MRAIEPLLHMRQRAGCVPFGAPLHLRGMRAAGQVVLMDAAELFEEGKRWIRAHCQEGRCPKCGKPLPRRRQTWCSDECRDWWWNTFHWGMITKRIMARDNFTCKICGRAQGRGVRLAVHHIRPWSVSHDNSDSNLITVCYECHAKLHANDNWKLMVDAQKCKKLEAFK